ncbi:phage tail protein [Pantoea sp. LMR881]|uniref:phage tail protein n=1 Tax=Pantoea sp. LMR881 TaxID=3014336 RepID=UPI0022B026CB|nr:phage tail protein [Pantoea sp. LMR881]MCZ4061284.1 phage tail protein [Pantoea sp. LMR881]
MADFEKDRFGRYVTQGLSPKQFDKVFDTIHQDRQKRRRQKARQLTPAVLKNKNLDEILKLGKKQVGTFFTIDDLKSFERNRKQVRKQYTGTQTGITHAQLVANSRSIDVKRANNNVDDGSGITSAAFKGMRHNVALIDVTASQRSVHKNHRVEIRFETWDEALEDAAGNDVGAQQRIAKKMVKDRVSVNCNCGRYQYWYRYIATAGNFTIAPPKEYVYPKLKNPTLEGVACKHIIHALTRMQGSGWQSRVLMTLRKNAAGEHYGDDPKKTTEYFTDDEIKRLNRNRKSQTNQRAARAEFNRYQARLDALAGKLKATDKQQLTKTRKQLLKARTITQKEQARREAAQRKLEEATAERDALKQQLADTLIMQKQIFIDAQVMAGKTPEQARRAYLEHVKSKLGN